ARKRVTAALLVAQWDPTLTASRRTRPPPAARTPSWAQRSTVAADVRRPPRSGGSSAGTSVSGMPSPPSTSPVTADLSGGAEGREELCAVRTGCTPLSGEDASGAWAPSALDLFRGGPPQVRNLGFSHACHFSRLTPKVKLFQPWRSKRAVSYDG